MYLLILMAVNELVSFEYILLASESYCFALWNLVVYENNWLCFTHQYDVSYFRWIVVLVGVSGAPWLEKWTHFLHRSLKVLRQFQIWILRLLSSPAPVSGKTRVHVSFKPSH